MSEIKDRHQKGQAFLEYLLILVLIVTVASQFQGSFKDIFGDRFFRFGHILSRKLSTGVCKTECFFSGYQNDYSGAE